MLPANSNSILQPTPIGCRNCHATVFPRRTTINKETQTITEGEWRCPQCGTFLKKGVLSIVDKK